MRRIGSVVGLIGMWFATTGGGCTSSVIRELAKDPASACVTVSSVYGTIKIYRTAIKDGSVKCNQDGMDVRSGTP